MGGKKKRLNVDFEKEVKQTMRVVGDYRSHVGLH